MPIDGAATIDPAIAPSPQSHLSADMPVAVPASPAAPVRVAILVGDQATRHCGVKDAAHVLASSLQALGITADVLAPSSWGWRDVRHLLRTIRAGRYDVLHIQYPSAGFRFSLVPHLIGLLRLTPAAAATLHEYTAFKLPQRLSTHLFRASADAIFFGSEFEQNSYNRFPGRIGASQSRYPILSQVPFHPWTEERDLTVAYFGQIRPEKGLEAFLGLAELSQQQGRPYTFHIIGSISSSNAGYASKLLQQAPSAVRWSHDLTFADVAENLSRSFAAYLPFPDGASERLGSLPAAWVNGLPVLSRIGPATTPSLAELLLPAHNAQQALATLDSLLAAPGHWLEISKRVSEYARSCSWEEVAERHANIYRGLLRALGCPATGSQLRSQPRAEMQ